MIRLLSSAEDTRSLLNGFTRCSVYEIEMNSNRLSRLSTLAVIDNSALAGVGDRVDVRPYIETLAHGCCPAELLRKDGAYASKT